MKVRRSSARVAQTLALVVGLSTGALAQLAQSPNYELEGIGFGAAGGGICAMDSIVYTTIGEPSGGTFSSENASAEIGFLSAFDPDLPASLVVFGISPNFGHTSGGTSVTVSGFNFDKLGSGPSMQVFVGGAPATGVQVLSNTTLTFTTPPGLNGPRQVMLVNAWGSLTLPVGFVYTPAITTSPTVFLGGSLTITNYGALGDFYTTFVSTSTAVLPSPPYGTLLIGPVPLVQLILPKPYPGPDGVHPVTLPVPVLPILSGLVVHFQSVSIFPSAFPPGKFTNASSTSIL